MYAQESPRAAARFASRLEGLLRAHDPKQEAIRGQECRSLIHEAKGNLALAIKHRRNEIRLIRRLRRTRPRVSIYRPDHLADRLDLLAALYHDAGQLERALSTLKESKRVCSRAGIKFGGRRMMRDYLREFTARRVIAAGTSHAKLKACR